MGIKYQRNRNRKDLELHGSAAISDSARTVADYRHIAILVCLEL